MTELRNHLNLLGRPQRLIHENINGFRPGVRDDDDQTMTGALATIGATILNTDEDADADEELDDVDAPDVQPLLFGNGGAT